jgi:hypothetical protein
VLLVSAMNSVFISRETILQKIQLASVMLISLVLASAANSTPPNLPAEMKPPPFRQLKF